MRRRTYRGDPPRRAVGRGGRTLAGGRRAVGGTSSPHLSLLTSHTSPRLTTRQRPPTPPDDSPGWIGRDAWGAVEGGWRAVGGLLAGGVVRRER